MPTIAAILPARGGSKGVPDKNLQIVGSRTLLARTIHTWQRAHVDGSLTVSTDSQQIANLARTCGAAVLERSEELAGDSITTEAVISHWLDSFGPSECQPHIVVLLQCTTPFVASTDIRMILRALEEGADCAFTAVPDHSCVWMVNDTEAVPLLPPGIRLPRQEMPRRVRENGAVYAFRSAAFRKVGNRFTGRIVPVIADGPFAGIEIDSETDLFVTRLIATWWESMTGCGAVWPPKT